MTNKYCRANHRRATVQCVCSKNDHKATHNTNAGSLETCIYSRRVLARGVAIDPKTIVSGRGAGGNCQIFSYRTQLEPKSCSFTSERSGEPLGQIRAPCFGHKRFLTAGVDAEEPLISCSIALPGLFIVPALAGSCRTSELFLLLETKGLPISILENTDHSQLRPY